MAKYTEEELFKYEEEAHVPQPEVLDEFNKLVESVSVELAKSSAKKQHNGDTFIDEFGNERSYNYLNRRRGSRSNAKPLKKKAQEVEVDDDGWATLKQHKKSFGQDEVDEREQFRDSLRSEPTKVKLNSKKMGSKAVDSRDSVADKQTNTFNAFAFLGDESEDDESD